MIKKIQHQGFISLVLTVFVLASALAVSYSVHVSRQLVGELSHLQRDHDALQMEWEKLLVEQNMLAAYNYIELRARQELGMRSPEKENVQVMDLRGVK